MYKILSLLTFAFLAFFHLALQAQELDTTLWVTSGEVKAIVRDENTIYLGGNFNYVGPSTGAGCVLHSTDGSVKTSVNVVGNVSYTLADGSGGFYIGGNFTHAQGMAISYLAHILSDGKVDPTWNASISGGEVRALSLSENRLYIAGSFTAVGGQVRTGLASIDIATALVTSWQPGQSNGSISEMVLHGNSLYIAGGFTSVNGQTRHNLASFDISTGQLTSWNPMANSRVNALTIANQVLYIGGDFTLFDGIIRNKLAAVDLSTGNTTFWAPVVGHSSATQAYGVMDLAVSNGMVYISGFFEYVDGNYRRGLAAISEAGILSSWYPVSTTEFLEISAIAVSANTLYATGTIVSNVESAKYKIVAINATSSEVITWQSFANNGISSIAVSTSNLFVGGYFTSVGGVIRNNLTSLDASSGKATDWNPDVRGTIYSLSLTDSLLYIGGRFTTVMGKTRNSLAAIHVSDGKLSSWHPDAGSGSIFCITPVDSSIYIGGAFSAISGQARQNIASFDASTGQLTSWNPTVNGRVNALALHKNSIYIGGTFTSVNGQARNGLAGIDVLNGQLTPLLANLSGYVNSLHLYKDILYIAGSYSNIGGQARNGLAALDLISGQVTSFDPVVNNSSINGLALYNNMLYIAGQITAVGGQARKNIAAIDIITGLPTPWKPDVDNQVQTMSFHQGIFYLGGSFRSVEGKPYSHFAALGRKLPTTPNLIKGRVYEDSNGDCLQDLEEKALAGKIIVAEPGSYYAITDSAGNYSIAVDKGNYTVRQVIAEHTAQLTQQVCPLDPSVHNLTFETYGDTVAGKDFGNKTTYGYDLSVHVSSLRRRRCFTSSTIISYCNNGNKEADSVKVYVKLPKYVALVNAVADYEVDQDSNYVFHIGKLSPYSCGSIVILDSVMCGNAAISGLSQCTKAWITPANTSAPSPEWDRSDITLKSNCRDNGLVQMGIYNSGEGNMADSSSFRIYLDAALAFQHNFKLVKGDSLILQVPANGRTLRLEADQPSHHPTKRQSSLTIEACGASSEGVISKGYVFQMPQDDAEPEVAIECLPIVDSYDPNDKLVLPAGVTDQHYTPTGQPLHYTIRFQNTGTAVAYKVVVVDTLSEHLEIGSLTVSAVSHPYKMTLTGKGRPVLIFTFDNINLADSATNQLASHGYIKFSIVPKVGIAEKTRIENYADIFFDYNPPVRTNTTYNSIYDMPLVVSESSLLDESIICTATNTTIDAGNHRSICEQDTIRLQASYPVDSSGRWKLIKGKGIIEAPSDPHSSVNGLAYGENIFEWSISSNTCKGDSLKAMVIINRLKSPQLPQISQTSADSLKCSLSGSTYQWFFDGKLMEENTQVIFVNQSGNYQVQIKDEQECSSALSAVFTYMVTGIDQVLHNRVEIFPNPSRGRFTVVLPIRHGEQMQLSVMNSLGREVIIRSFTNTGKEEVDLSAVVSGVYLISIKTMNGVVVRRVIKL